MSSLGRSFYFLLLILFASPTLRALGQEETILLKNGLAITGIRGAVAGLNEQIAQKQTEPKFPHVFVMDDGLRQVFFHHSLATDPIASDPPFKIELKNASRRENDGRPINGVLDSTGLAEFDQFGRRICRVVAGSHRGNPIEVLQGITEVTPTYLKVETMRMESAPRWDMRISTRALGPEKLKAILLTNADLNDENDWMDVVSFFAKAKMYSQAIDVLEKAMQRHPSLEIHRSKLTVFVQAIADQMFDEVQLRRKSGQYQLASALLRGFSMDRLADETRIKIEKRLGDNQNELARFEKIVTQLRDQFKQIQDLSIQTALSPVIEEIANHISPSTIDRMVDYDRLRDDSSMTVEQRVALGVGGWLLGPGIGLDKISVAKSLVEVRGLVGKYLASPSDAERAELMKQIKKLEGGVPRYIAPMVSKLLPPLPLPSPVEGDPTRFKIEVSVPQLDGEKTFYYLQLPPEYDPYRSYPCIIALHGSRYDEEGELQWWAGRYNEAWKMTDGEAARHGYIVMSPKWNRDDQTEYESTENEHARVLACMRDAMRRTSIDSNRVFIAGHYEGGTMAWEMAVSHPDLWAGLVSIGGDSTKYTKAYYPNAKYIPMYFVVGEVDGIPSPLTRNGEALDRYVQSSFYDFMLVMFNGRGRDNFIEELSRIMDWMDLPSHTRAPLPEKKIEVRSTRPGDHFFWWLEFTDTFADKANHPLREFSPKAVVDITMERNSAANFLSLAAVPSKKYSIWFDATTIDFGKKVSIRERGKTRQFDVDPSLEILLEDVRTRSDRQRPFLARIDSQ